MTQSEERWLVTGAGGQLGSVLLARLTRSAVNAVGLLSPAGPAPLEGRTVRTDITSTDEFARLMRSIRPSRIIHAAAVTSVQYAFEHPDLATKTNVDATRRLVELAAESSSRLVYISTDLVFDGSGSNYTEDSTPAPLSIYGRTKLAGEQVVRGYERGLAARLPLMYGIPAVDRATTFCSQLDAIRHARPLRLFEDEFRSPLWLEDAAESLMLLARSDFGGLIHVAGPERLSRMEMGRCMAQALRLDAACLQPIRQADMQFSEPRPRDVSLDSSRFSGLFARPAGRPMREAMLRIAAG